MGDLAREMIRNRFKYIGEFEKCRNHIHERGMATYLKIIRNIEKSLRENSIKDRLVLHFQIPEELEARLEKVEL